MYYEIWNCLFNMISKSDICLLKKKTTIWWLGFPSLSYSSSKLQSLFSSDAVASGEFEKIKSQFIIIIDKSTGNKKINKRINKSYSMEQIKFIVNIG